MFSTYSLIVSTLIGLVCSQSNQPVIASTPIPMPTLGSASFNGYSVCLSIVNSALQTLNSTFELQSSTTGSPFDLNLLPVDCFYLKSSESTCKSFPPGLRDMFSMMLWVTQLIQQCNIPGSWAGYPETINNLNPGVRQFQASLSSSGSAAPVGSLGVSGSLGTNGGLGSMQMGNGYGQGSGMMSNGLGSGTPMMMVPVQAAGSISAVPPNPFSTMMGIIGSSVGPQGITISPATIAGILSLINQVVGIAVQLAPIGGAVAGPLLAGALG
ncbi:uncharacterized protein LOC128396196 [Panonychus citri]|uniref:uncharacterized protein LOC128396196 n=1 Tax=Panonychus citri TaxID=50023 RepID=UPI00230730DF|nr:uncharacterized protein LOC128396196 [Panonychus citri]